MTAWTIETVATGEVRDALGPDPQGFITYTPDGRMMVLVLKNDRPRPAGLVPTADEKIGLYDTMFAYAGTWTVEDDHVVHAIDMSWNGAWNGTRQIRFVEIDAATLRYRSPVSTNPLDGTDCVHRVTFERV